MTAHQLNLFNLQYLVILCGFIIVTRPTLWRLAGAISGSALDGLIALPVIAMGDRAGWWHMAITGKPYFLLLLWIDFALCGFVFLLTWRIARRFGARGLTVALIIAALFGPIRDYAYRSRFPEWGNYSSGLAPVCDLGRVYSSGRGGPRTDAADRWAGLRDALARRPWAPA